MANRYIQTHTPDGNELDNKILPEGTIAVRGNQLIVGDGVTEASELEPSGDPAWAGGGVSFVIASGTVDLNVSGTTELTYASGVNGGNCYVTHIVFEPANGTDTYTNDGGQDPLELWYENLTSAQVFFGANNSPEIVYNTSKLIQEVTLTSIVTNSAYAYNVIVGATPPSTTQFRVTVKVLGIKIS